MNPTWQNQSCFNADIVFVAEFISLILATSGLDVLSKSCSTL